MILYDIRCDNCGDVEVFANVSDIVDSTLPCDGCGERGRVVPSQNMHFVGVIFCESHGQAGVEWYSNREKKAWMSEHGVREVSADSGPYARQVERARDLTSDRAKGIKPKRFSGRLKRAAHG